jgi:hypothetical protein
MKSFVLNFLWLCLTPVWVYGQVIEATPADYSSLLSTLQPGDTLLLLPGEYTNRLNVHSIEGTAQEPIVIMGSGEETVFLGNSCCNTVSLKTSAHIVIRDFLIDGQNIPNIDAVKAEGNSGNWAHHITIENLKIIGHGANQVTVGISTKCPTWDWVIRGCEIVNAGTGMYLGNSDGEEPFVNGLIEYNVITGSRGYNLQIKRQNVGSRDVPGMTLNGKTVIRHNVLSKANSLSGSARPNLLVGNFPATGDGADDYYEIYGNFFWQNATESLFQGTGNIAFYNNIGVNYAGGNGFTFQAKDGFKPRNIQVFHNTVVCTPNWGIRLFDTDPAYQKYVYGNAVFSDHATPIRVVGSGVSSVDQQDNTIDVVGNANTYVANATNVIAELDLFPIEASPLKGAAVSQTPFTTFLDYSQDFDYEPRDWTYRGAYSGEGTHEGWKLALEQKPFPDTILTKTIDVEHLYGYPALLLYPNPADQMVNLQLPLVENRLQVQLISLDGQVLAEKQVWGQREISFDVRSLAPGVYLIRVVGAGEDALVRWVKR